MKHRRQESDGEVNDGRHTAVRRTLLLAVLFLYPFAPPFPYVSIAPGFNVAAAESASWKKQVSGTLAWLHAVYFVDENRGWAVGGKGALLATTDGGAHWELKRSPTEDSLRDLSFVDAQTGWLVCERSIYALKTRDESRSYLLKTMDGGESWERVQVSGAEPDVRLVRVVFADREHGWVFGEAGALYATTDGGLTWERRHVPTRRLLLGGTFLDARRGWIVGAGSTVLQTVDGGATWRAGEVEKPAAPPVAQASTSEVSRPTSVRFNAVSFVDARRGWAVGAAGAAYATTNGGRSWRAVRTGVDADLFDVKFLDEREGRATGSGGTVIHTVDGGATWRTERTGTSHPLERLFFSGRSRGWAVGFGGTIITFAPSVAPAQPKLRRASPLTSQATSPQC